MQAEICLLRLTLVFLLDDPGVDAPGVSGDNLSDQALWQQLPQGLSDKATAKIKPLPMDKL